MAPGTTSAWVTPRPAPARPRLRITDGFTVIDGQQRRLRERTHTLGFADLDSYLAARSQHEVDVAQLASELDTTIEVIGRLLDKAGLRRSPRPAHSAHHRRATDQRLKARVAQLGFPDLPAYLADRVAGQAWSLAQLASELGVNPKTVKDRLDRLGLRRGRHTLPSATATSGRRRATGRGTGAAGGAAGRAWLRRPGGLPAGVAP